MPIQCANEIRNMLWIEYIVQLRSINHCSIYTYSLVRDILIQQKNILLTFPCISSSLMCLKPSCHVGIHFYFSLSDCSSAVSPAGMSATNSSLETLKWTPAATGELVKGQTFVQGKWPMRQSETDSCSLYQLKHWQAVLHPCHDSRYLSLEVAEAGPYSQVCYWEHRMLFCTWAQWELILFLMCFSGHPAAPGLKMK